MGILFRRTSKVFGLKIVAALFAFLIQVQLGRMLGMDDYGSFSLFLSVSSVACVLPVMGMDSGLIREIAAADSSGYRKWCIVISLICAGIILVLLGFLMPWLFPYLAMSLSFPYNIEYLLTCYLSILVFNTLAGAVLQGEQRNVLNDGTVALTSFFKVFTIYILSEYDAGLYEVIFSYIVLEMCCMIGRWFIVFKNYKNVEIVWQPMAEAKKYIWYCLPLLLVSSIGIVQCSLHRFVTAYFMDSYSVGVLRVCENFSGALSLFVAPFVTTWPLMAAYYREGQLDEIRSMFKQCSVAITVMIMPALTTVIVCAPELLGLFKLSIAENQTLIFVLLVFCLGTVYDAIIGPAGALLKMTEYSRINFYNAVVLLFLTIAFSYVLIPLYGLMGAAGALSLSHFAANTLNAWQNYRLFGLMPYGKAQFGLIVWSLPVYGMVMCIRNIVGISGILAVLLYGFVIYLMFGLFILLFYKSIRGKTWLKIRGLRS